MKGIILAGGNGTRLMPLTKVTSKQLLPIYNKPMIYYSLQSLITAGIKEILVIVAPDRSGDFLKLLGSGRDLGCKITYEIQDNPGGLAQAFLIGANFIGKENVTLILGDNIFEDDFSESIMSFKNGGRIFIKQVSDPERFGVAEFNQQGKVISIEEKPVHPKSDYAVTGLYIYDTTVADKARTLKPSARGELEITDLNNLYLKEDSLDVSIVKGAWFDTGTFESLYSASSFIRNKCLLQQK